MKGETGTYRQLLKQAIVGLLCALGSGVLFASALPLGEKYYLAWFMLCPLLWTTRGKGFLWGFALALVTIFSAAGIAQCGFLYSERSLLGNPNWIYTTFGIYGFSLALAVGIWADPASKKMKAWWFAALGVILEAILLLGLPAHLALTQYRQLPMLFLAGIGGVWLVSYLIWWSNFALVTMPLRKAAIWGFALAALSVGGSRIHVHAGGRLVRFGVVQIDQPDEDKMVSGQRQAAAAGAELTVWPEFAGMPFVSTGAAVKLAALSASSGSGIVTSFEDNFQPLPHNCSAVFWKGTESALYNIRQLFGGEAKMHTPGTLAAAAEYSAGRAGLNICFDSCYPEVIRDSARLRGVNVICLPSTDPVAPNNFVAAMHAAYGPFRAAEEGMAFIKADGDAYSNFIDPYGQFVAELRPGDGVLTSPISTTVHGTLYKTFGDWYLCLSGLLIVVGILSGKKSPKN